MLTTEGYYTQTTGLAMGSPLSPLLANAWLTQFDTRFKSRKSKFYYRYVDDIIMTLHADVIERTIVNINKWHNALEFTYEIEDQNGD